MNYRLHNYSEAARLMDEQIEMFPAGIEGSGGSLWRGRIFEDEEKNFGQAVNYYHALTASYVNSYYAGLARATAQCAKDSDDGCCSCGGFEFGAGAGDSGVDRGVAGE